MHRIESLRPDRGITSASHPAQMHALATATTDIAEPLRVVIGDDDVWLRERLVEIVSEAGFQVVGEAGDADDFLSKALVHRPDVAIVDIQMPPNHTDDGLQAAIALRRRCPGTGVVVISAHCEEQYAIDLIGDSAAGVGYLLKERLGDVKEFTTALWRVAGGGSALDPEVVARMLGRPRHEELLPRLSRRERDVLAHVAEGRSTAAIAGTLCISVASVENHLASIFHRLGLCSHASEHHRAHVAITSLLDADR